MEIYNKLTESIKNNNNILIMTHKNPDLDGISSAICLAQLVNLFNKNASIYLKNEITNQSVLKSLQILDDYDTHVKFTNKYNNYDILIIIDVNKEMLLENNEILNKFKEIIILDHHIPGNDRIKGTIEYVNENLSSMAEFFTNYVRYLNKNIGAHLSTILLAAIEVDTNNYMIKTNSNTHQTAAYLFDQGADILLKQELLKENKEIFLKRQELIKNTKLINDIAICLFDNKVYDKVELALTSEELISFDGIEAAYTIGNIKNNVIGISARSTGKYNVEQIMKKFNGGGHNFEAAAEIKNKTKEELTKQLMEVLNESNIY